MDLFDVYQRWDVEPVRAKGCKIYDKNGVEYLDFYGGHAVISIGHSHPYYIKKIREQLNRLGFYSNAVQNSLQKELANKLGKASGYENYHLFLVNSGAEANENALKIASFYNNRKKILAFGKAFHGRTAAAVKVTDNDNYHASIYKGMEVVFLPLNDLEAVKKTLATKEISSVIIEGIQGVGGIRVPDPAFLKGLSKECAETDTVLILDEIQSGYGRSGKFFAHQYAGIQPDLITTAKGMGNGFPISGVLIHPKFKAVKGQLGTTFGGNHLACAAAIAVLDVFEKEDLISNAKKIGEYLKNELTKFSEIKEIRGEGLMIGLEFDRPIKELRDQLLFEEKIFTGASGSNIFRLLPPLCVSLKEAGTFIERFGKIIK